VGRSASEQLRPDTRRKGAMGIGIRIEELPRSTTRPAHGGARRRLLLGRRATGAKRRRNSKVLALDGISLEIQPRRVFRIAGPNGAGRTTHHRPPDHARRADQRAVFVGRHDVWKHQVKAKRLIGVVPQRPNWIFPSPPARSCFFTAPIRAEQARARAAQPASFEKFQADRPRRPHGPPSREA